MDRYLVISHHTAEDCRMAVKHFLKYHANYMTHFDWGCKDGVHDAFAIIEADSHEMAKMSVPPLLRDKATVIRLVQFRPEQFPELTKDPNH